MSQPLKVAIAGVGFIGQVHVRSARLAGAQVIGVAGGDRNRTEATAARLRVDHVYETAEALVDDPSVDVVHVCTPNNLHEPLVERALAAGKHVVCEKPLATTLEGAEKLAALAAAGDLVTAVPFVYRFHPVVREARYRVASGETGALHLIHGSYQQDWLASPDDYNWRIDSAMGGESRAFADIGSHWCDLVEFVSGHRITRVSARTVQAIPERLVDEREAFAKGTGEGRREPVAGEDAVTMMFETDKGAAGTLVVSQVSHGRKNRLWFELDGLNEALVFDQEHPEELWVGRRSGSQTVVRDPGALSPDAARLAFLPAGHAQGYADCFDNFVADTYATVRGEEREGLPGFADGLRAARITDAMLTSARNDTWREVR